MATVAEKTTDYVLGYSDIEAQRLKVQAQLLRGWTDRFFRAAGLAGARRILDVGCGMGDVSMLAAEIAGPEATVLGIDRDATSIEKARARIAEAGLANRIEFLQTDVTQFQPTEQFDAIVGRYILLYQRDAAASLRHVAQFAKPGGLMVFHEIDFGGVPRTGTGTGSVPALWDWAYTILGEGFRSGGADPSFGLKLAPAFLGAGLGWPSMMAECAVGGEPGSYLYWWIPATIKSILPAIEKAGLATTAEIDIETLPRRLEEACTAAKIQLIGPTQYGAWVRVV